MRKIEMYRVTRASGGVDITPVRPTADAVPDLYRLVADKDHVLVCGKDKKTCVDTDNPDGWTEMEQMTDADYIQAAKILLGEV